MVRKVLLLTALVLSASGAIAFPRGASAETPLTRAVVQNLRNQVLLLLKNQAPRPARRSDVMTPGDALQTSRSSLAELRFNDRSLARVGERAIFRFQPNTRTFVLDNGTLLLLIPPKQGKTRVKTPNAVAGIRGSALFVRHNPDNNLTLVGALTNSEIEVSNNDASQSRVLAAGQMAAIVNNQIVRIYNFDLNTFYETSDLVKGLDLPMRSATPSEDPAIAAVQAETSEALKAQTPIAGAGVTENPPFVFLTPDSVAQSSANPANPAVQTLPGSSSVSTDAYQLITNASDNSRRANSQTRTVEPIPAGPTVVAQPPQPVRPVEPTRPALPEARPGSRPPELQNPSRAEPAIPPTPGVTPPGTGATPASPANPTPATPTPPVPAPASPPVTATPPASTPVTPATPPVAAPAPAPVTPVPAVTQPPVTATPPVSTPVTPTTPPVAAPAPAPVTPVPAVTQPSVPTPVPTTPTPALPPTAAPGPSPIAQPPVRIEDSLPGSIPPAVTPIQPPAQVPAAVPAPVPVPTPVVTPPIQATPPALSTPAVPASVPAPVTTPAVQPAINPAPVQLPQVQIEVAPTVPATPATPATPVTPVTPATPATPAPRSETGVTIPATPASPAQPQRNAAP